MYNYYKRMVLTKKQLSNLKKVKYVPTYKDTKVKIGNKGIHIARFTGDFTQEETMKFVNEKSKKLQETNPTSKVNVVFKFSNRPENYLSAKNGWVIAGSDLIYPTEYDDENVGSIIGFDFQYTL